MAKGEAVSDTHTSHAHEPDEDRRTCRHCGVLIEPEVCEACGAGGERRCYECNDTGVARWVEVK